MAQHDYNIANQSGADFRADLNNALLAIATVNSGSTEPSTTFAHQLWVDTSSSVLKIRNAADNAWITTGVSITSSNTFTGNLTGNVTGNLTGNVTGNVTGDLTGNADSADILTTARTISLSGDVVGSVSFDGSANIDIDTVVQINSITLGTDTTGDYVESMSGGTGVTVTGGTGEGSTPSIAIGQSVATSDDVTFNNVTATNEFFGDIDGAVRFTAKADESLSKGDIVYVSGVSGNTTTVGKAKADDASKMPAFGMAIEDANANNNLQIVTFGNLTSIDTSNESVGEILYVSTTAGEYTTTAPSGESAQIQNIGKVLRSHAVNGSIKVGGAGRSNATPNLDNGKIFIGNGSNQSVTSTLDTSIVVENTNLYYTTTRANTDFDSRLATKDTGDLTEGSNLYYTTARVNSDFDTRLATKSTTNLAEGTNLYYTTARFDSAFTSKDTDDLSEGTTNLYYTTARFDSAFGNKTTADLTENTNLYYTDTRANSAIDTRVTKAFVDALGIQASSVDANSVTLGTDTVGNYVATVTGTANKITVSGSGSESANITLSLPDDVQIADSLTVAGNLTVNGTLTSLDTTNLDIEDNLFQLNAGLTGSPVNDSGMLINRGTADNSIFMWDESVDKFTLGLTTADGSATGNITLNSLGTLVANLEGNVTGNVTGTVSSLSNHDTDDLAEGTNLYYTQARFDSALAAKSTSDLSEGSNLYYTDARFDTRLASKDTDDVSEGTSNLYYTSTRFNSAFSGKSTSDLSEGSNLYYTDARVQAVSINNVVEDTTPQLGGDLDLNSSDITGTGDINITGTIQSSGNLGIGTSPSGVANYKVLQLRGGSTSNGGLIRLETSDGTSGVARFYAGSSSTVLESTSNTPLAFGTNGTERARLDTSGNLLVGTTSSANTTDGVRITSGGYITIAQDAASVPTLFLNKITNDGQYIQFQKDGSEVGSIGTASSELLIGSTTGNDAFLKFGYGAISPSTSAGSNSDNYIDLGKATSRFKDLYLSGTATATTLAGTLSTAAQPNITSLGTLTSFRSTGIDDNADATAITIDSSENVGIGNAVASSMDAGANNLVVGTGSGTEGMTIYSGTANSGVIYFADGASGDDRFRGQIGYSHSDNAFSFRTNASASANMTILSDGKVSVGGTSSNHLLNVTSATTPALEFTRGSGNATIGIDNGNSIAVGGTAGDLVLRASGTTGVTKITDSGGNITMTLTEANNVGIGTTSPTEKLTLNGALAITGALSDDRTSTAAMDFSSGVTRFVSYGASGVGGQFAFRTASGGASSTERMRIDSSGKVGIGIANPADYYSDNLVVSSGTDGGITLAATATNLWNFLLFADGTAGDAAYRGQIAYNHAADQLAIASSDFITFGTGSSRTEKMRIDSSGNVLINQSSSYLTYGKLQVSAGGETAGHGGIVAFFDTDGSVASSNLIQLLSFSGDTDATGGQFIRFRDSNSVMGSVSAASGTTVAYNTSSDRRMKENIVDASSQLDVINNIQIREFDWVNNGHHEVGVIAQELNEVIPNVVQEGGEDVTEEPWGVDYGKLTPYLIKAVQEQQAQIEALQSEINLLKGE